FSQLGWYFISEWRRYLGAIIFLIMIAVLQLIPPRLVGIIVDGISANTMSSDQLLMWLGVLLIIALAIYGLRYVWRVWLFGASYRLAV
ncbi:multidrug ABC transporter permease/ATP-binding protein, partial [Xenorhabdus bovienii]|nr:multidrug ABC transporter permease/ATP-binding protein [Xenorhabdus bovienii]